jgi:hypothetical protein
VARFAHRRLSFAGIGHQRARRLTRHAGLRTRLRRMEDIGKGRTAIDGLSGSASAARAGVPSRRRLETRTGRAMFLSCCSPMPRQ